jgi:hypothetical protein
VLVPSRRHEDPLAVKKGLDDVGGAGNVLVTSCRAHREYEGKTLDEIGGQQRVGAVDVYIQIVKDGGAGVVCRSMKESDMRVFYRQPWVMVASDGRRDGIRGAPGLYARLGDSCANEFGSRLKRRFVNDRGSGVASGLERPRPDSRGNEGRLVIFDPKRGSTALPSKSRCCCRRNRSCL